MSREPESSPTPEEARAFGRWLDQPGSPAPDGLDEEAAQAVYALRPDLAPAPNVTVDDILAGVVRGPLSNGEAPGESSAADGADIVPFPEPEPAAGPAETSAPRPARLAWAGGIGGAGLALVAAATLLLTVVPSGAPDQAALESSSPASAPPELQKKVPLERQIAAADDVDIDSKKELPASPPPARRRAEREPSVGRLEEAVADAPAGPAPSAVENEERFDIAQRTALVERSVIPEVSAKRKADAVDEIAALADEEAEPAEAAKEGVTEGGSAREDRSVQEAPSWRSGAPAGALATADGALTRANALAASGKPAAGADILSRALTGPGPVAHELALRAAELYLQADDPAAAIEVLQRATTLGAPTPDQAARRATLQARASE